SMHLPRKSCNFLNASLPSISTCPRSATKILSSMPCASYKATTFELKATVFSLFFSSTINRLLGNTPIKTSPLIKSLLWPHRPTLKNLQRDQLPPYIPTQGTPMPAPQKNCLSYTQGQSLASPPRLALN